VTFCARCRLFVQPVEWLGFAFLLLFFCDLGTGQEIQNGGRTSRNTDSSGLTGPGANYHSDDSTAFCIYRTTACSKPSRFVEQVREPRIVVIQSGPTSYAANGCYWGSSLKRKSGKGFCGSIRVLPQYQN
jgi:hypothetical protein